MENLFSSNEQTPHYVYIIKCSTGSHYVGCTNDLKRRIQDHNNGKVKSTSYRKPVKLVTYIGFDNIYSAYRIPPTNHILLTTKILLNFALKCKK